MSLLRQHRSIVAFVAIALIAVTYGAITYVKLPRLLGIGRDAVTVELPEGAGLYPNSIVTLRGVEVGQVDGVRLLDEGVAADIQIDREASVPVDSAVEVRSTSAVGEQYLNFEPTGTGGPVLEDASVVPADRVSVPVPVANLLGRANDLVASVPQEKLSRTIDEISAALRGSGGDLQRILDNAAELQRELDANIEPTIRLIDDLQPVLQTQVDGADATRSITRDLASFTDRLRESDGDLRGTLRAFPPFLDEFGGLLDGLRPTVPLLLEDLTAVGQVARVYLPNVAQTVTILKPTLDASIGALVSSPVPNSIKVDFDLVVNDPPPCTQGFEENRRSPSDLSPARPATNAFCDVAPDSPQAVRGGRNYLCPPGSPNPGRSITARGCGWNFQSPQDAAAATEAAIQTQLEVAASNPTTNAENTLRPDALPDDGPNTNPDQPVGGGTERAAAEPGTGLFHIPGTGETQVLGSARARDAEGWAGFLVNPLGGS